MKTRRECTADAPRLCLSVRSGGRGGRGGGDKWRVIAVASEHLFTYFDRERVNAICEARSAIPMTHSTCYEELGGTYLLNLLHGATIISPLGLISKFLFKKFSLRISPADRSDLNYRAYRSELFERTSVI